MAILNVKDYGAFGDGGSHPLSSKYGTSLTAAQADYPFADDLTNEIDRCAIQKAIASVPTSGGQVIVPPGTYLIDKPMTAMGSKLEILGAGSGVTAFQRVGTGPLATPADFGVTITFGISTGQLNYVGISGIRFRDTDTTPPGMTIQKSPFHVVFDGCSKIRFNDIVVDSGTGVVKLLGCDQFYSNQCYATLKTGDATQQINNVPVGREAVFVGASANTHIGAAAAQCSDIFFTDLNLKMHDDAFVNHVNVGVHVQAVDGMWLTSPHIEGSAFANLFLDCVTVGGLGNVFITNLMSDICGANGVVIKGATGTPCKRIKIEGQCSVARLADGNGSGLLTQGSGVQDLDLDLGVDGHKVCGIQLTGTDDRNIVIRPRNIIDGGEQGNGISIESGSDIVVSGGIIGSNIDGGTDGQFNYGVYVGADASNVTIDTTVQNCVKDGILIGGAKNGTSPTGSHNVSVRGVSRGNGGTGLRILSGSTEIDFNLKAFGNTGLANDMGRQIVNTLEISGSTTTSPYWIKQANVEHA